jgi:RIO kinase 2
MFKVVVESHMMAAGKFKDLEKNDFGILAAAELLMKRHEYVPHEELVSISRLRDDEVAYRIRALAKDRFLVRGKGELLGYQGYTLTMSGYDALALRALVSSGAIEAIGKSLGVGKESDIYEALGSRGRRCAVKFHRLGRTSFRQTSRKRGFIAERSHISWLYQSRLSAEREYRALKRLYSVKVSVPKPIAQNRHVVAMGLIAGTELKYAEMEDAAPILREILRNVRRTYRKAELIHADLSEYNILIEPDGRILIIDWPQCVNVSHPSAESHLRKDLYNIVTAFRRKTGLDPDLEEVLQYVKGARNRVTL